MKCVACNKEATKEQPVGDCLYQEDPHCENCCKQLGHRTLGVHRWKPIVE